MSDDETDGSLQYARAGLTDAQFAARLRDAAPARTIAKVPCRGRCGRLADWTEAAQQAFDTFCRLLESRDEAPLDKTRIVFCEECRRGGQQLAGDRNRKLVDACSEAIRELKTGDCDQVREHELLCKLERAGHPDIAGLRQWLRDQPERKRGASGRGSL